MWGRIRRRITKRPMRDWGEIRIIVFWMDAKVLLTRSTTIAEWAFYERAGWKVFAVDPEDATAFTYWQDVDGVTLPCLT